MGTVFREERLERLAIQYACRTTPAAQPPYSAKARQDLLKEMRDTWPDAFDDEMDGQQFQELKRANPGVVCALKKRVFVGGMTAEVPALIVAKDAFTIMVPRILNAEKMGVEKSDLWLKRGANNSAHAVALKLSSILDVALHRTGKMAEMVFAPIAPDELDDLIKHIFGALGETPANIDANLTFIHNEDDHEYNSLLQLKAAPVVVTRPCPVAVKVDINNRDMTKSLDPRDLKRVWAVADGRMPEWLFDKLGGAHE